MIVYLEMPPEKFINFSFHTSYAQKAELWAAAADAAAAAESVAAGKGSRRRQQRLPLSPGQRLLLPPSLWHLLPSPVAVTPAHVPNPNSAKALVPQGRRGLARLPPPPPPPGIGRLPILSNLSSLSLSLLFSFYRYP